MNPSEIRRSLKNQKPLFGIWRLIQSNDLTEIIGLSGFQFQIFDREHGNFDFSAVQEGIRNCELVGCSPWVRVKGIDSVEVQRALDLGAHGIVFPQLRSLQDFRSAVECMKFPPLGRRGFNPFTRAGNYGGKSKKENKLTNDYALCVPIVETLSAVEELQSILTLPGIDMIYVGAYDLSVQLGCKGDMLHPKLVKTISNILAKCRKAKNPVCLMVKSSKEIAYYKRLGAFAYVYTVDTIVIRDAFEQKIQAAKSK